MCSVEKILRDTLQHCNFEILSQCWHCVATMLLLRNFITLAQRWLDLVKEITAQKWSFPLRISSVNVSCGFSHIYWKILELKTFFLQRMGPSSHSFQVINKEVSVQDISLGYVYKAWRRNVKTIMWMKIFSPLWSWSIWKRTMLLSSLN